MSDDIDFKKIAENAEARIIAALRVARSVNHSAARMTLSEAYEFIRAYNQAMHDTDPRRAQWEKEYKEAADLLKGDLPPPAEKMVVADKVERAAQAMWFDYVDQQGYPNGLPTWDEMSGLGRGDRREEFRSMARAAFSTEVEG